MKITADLVTRAGQFLNPLKDRELDLRAYKIPAIENLGASKDSFDCIDLSDNDIVRLENFPLLKRLKMLLLSNNRISRVADGLGAALPHLETLVLSNNRIATLAEIDGLAELSALTTLSLLQNPVNRRAHYRLYVIHKLPGLRVLDFQKIRMKEREAAAQLFASTEGRKLQAAVAKARSYTPSGSGAATDAGGDGAGQADTFTPAQLVLIQEAIAAANTPEDVDRLHRFLKAGKLPPELARQQAAAAAAGGGGGSGEAASAEEEGDGMEEDDAAPGEGDVDLT